MGDSVTPVESDETPDDDYHEHADDDEEPRTMTGIEDSADSIGKVINQ